MSDLGIIWSEQWRGEFLHLLAARNGTYRRSVLDKLRARATQARQRDLQSPLHTKVEAAVNDNQRLEMQLTKVFRSRLLLTIRVINRLIGAGSLRDAT